MATRTVGDRDEVRQEGNGSGVVGRTAFGAGGVAEGVGGVGGASGLGFRV